MYEQMLNLFEVYYHSGIDYKECVNNGPVAVYDALCSYRFEDLKKVSKQLNIPWLNVKNLADKEPIKKLIVQRVVDIAIQCSAFGDY